MKQHEADQCIEVFKKHVNTENIKFELLLGDDLNYIHKEYGLLNIIGFSDCLTNDTLYEFKCTGKLNEEHKCQLIMYFWLWNKSKMKEYYGERKFQLFNILSEEILELDINNPHINDIVELLFKNKYNPEIEISNKQFVERCIL
jgi:hypothetical protein